MTEREKTIKRPIPRLGTHAASNFFASHVTITRFYNWILFMASRIDKITEDASEILIKGEKDEQKRMEMEADLEAKKGKGMLDELVRNRQFFFEILLVRYVENYLNYLSELLYEIFIKRPETLRSSEKVELAHVLQYDSIDDFVMSAAERKVEALSYNSFNELAEYFNDRFSLELFGEEGFYPISTDGSKTFVNS